MYHTVTFNWSWPCYVVTGHKGVTCSANSPFSKLRRLHNTCCEGEYAENFLKNTTTGPAKDGTSKMTIDR